jgi:uncharacterized membrane-anchored protein YhcB (DUF1043 family)
MATPSSSQNPVWFDVLLGLVVGTVIGIILVHRSSEPLTKLKYPKGGRHGPTRAEHS